MNRNEFYIFQNEDGEIFAHATDSEVAFNYINTVISSGFKYREDVKGIAVIYTIFEN